MVGLPGGAKEPGIAPPARRRGYSSSPLRPLPSLSRKWSISGSGCPEPNLGAPGSSLQAARPARAVLAPNGALRLRPGPGVAMTSELDIFVGNTTLIDEDVYRLWLDGYSGVWGAVCGAGQEERWFGMGEGAGPGLGSFGEVGRGEGCFIGVGLGIPRGPGGSRSGA